MRRIPRRADVSLSGLFTTYGKDIAVAAKIGNATIRNFEASRSMPQNSTLDVLQRTFETAGVEFHSREWRRRGGEVAERGEMMINTFEVVEVQGEAKEKSLGMFDFHMPPCVGDRAEFGHSGAFGVFEVTWVLHRPLRTVPESGADELNNQDSGPAAKVYVRRIN